MDKIFENPWALRITALALAVLMFFTVKPSDINQIDSTISGVQEELIQDVPVELRYDDSNFVVTGVPQTVEVQIKGPVGIVITTKTGRNFKVIADVKDKPTGEHTITYKTEGFSDKLEVTVKPKTVKVKVEERITKDVKVEPEINESQISSDKYVKAMTTEPQTVTVSGAKSVVDSINYVKATVNAEKNVAKSFEKSASVKIFDRDLNILNIDVEPKTVKVKVELEEYNREVPLVINQKGKPAKGYAVDSLTSKTKKVLIYGSRNDIDKVQQLTVDADVAGLKKSKTVKGTIQTATGVKKMSTQSIDVKATILKEEDKEVASAENGEDATSKDESTDEDPPEDATEQDADDEQAEADSEGEMTYQGVDVQLDGLDTEQYSYEFINPTSGQIDIIAKGKQTTLDSTTAANIKAFVNASGVNEEGTKNLPVQITAIKGLDLTPLITNVKVHFTKQAS